MLTNHTTKDIYEKKVENESRERGNVTTNNIETEQYLGFYWNYEKRKEEEEKGDMDQRLAQTKRVKGCIQQHY